MNTQVDSTPQKPAFDSNVAIALAYGVDSALSDVFTFMQSPNARSAVTQSVSVTSACATAFASDGNIKIEGSFTWNSNGASDANLYLNTYHLTMDMTSCPLQAQSTQSPFVINANALTVDGSMTSSTDANGTLHNRFLPTTIVGGNVAALPSPDNNAFSCDVNLTTMVSYDWADNVSVNGNFSGVFCGQEVSGSVTRQLPVVSP